MSKSLWAAIAFCVLYALQITFQTDLVRGVLTPIQLIFLLNLTSVILLAAFHGIRRADVFRIRVPRRTAMLFLLSTFLWIGADISAVAGLQTSSTVNLSILSRLQLFITYVGAVLFLGEGLTMKKIVALLVASAGTMLTVYRGQSIQFASGDVLFLIFTVCISVSGLIRQQVGKTMPVHQMTFFMFVISTLITGGYVAVAQPIFVLPSVWSVLLIAFLMITGFTAVNYSIARGGASQFSLVSSLLPFITAVFAFVFLREVPTVYQLVGGIVIVAGIVLFVSNGRKRYTLG